MAVREKKGLHGEAACDCPAPVEKAFASPANDLDALRARIRNCLIHGS